MDIARNRTKKS